MTLVCNNCGHVNQPGSEKCEECGQDLSMPEIYGIAKQKPKPEEKIIPGPSKVHYEPPGVDTTATGLLLLSIGLFLYWIPDVKYFGYLLALVGGLLVFLGRRAFSSAHQRNAILSLVLIIVTFVFAIVIIFSLVGSILVSVSLGGTNQQIVQRLISAFRSYLLMLIVLSFISGLPYLLISFELQNSTGRLLLLISYILLITAIVVSYFVIMPLVTSTSNELLTNPGNTDTVVAGLRSKISTDSILTSLPYILFGISYLLARSRVMSGVLTSRKQ